MESRFKYHSQDGVTRTLVHDTADGPGKFTVHTELQMDAILASISWHRDNVRLGSVNKLVAQIPMTVYEKALLEGWDDDDWKKWLNDPDNEPFRVWKGRV